MLVDVWDHFSGDTSLFCKGGLHLNCAGKGRLDNVLDEEVRSVGPR